MIQRASDFLVAAIHTYAPPRKSISASLIEALHHSRREQARRVLRQFHHLIADIDISPAFESQKEHRNNANP